MMESIKTNFWLMVPALIIIPIIVATVIIHEKEEQDIVNLSIEFAIQENEFKVKEIASNVESIYELIDSKIDFITAAATIDGIISEEEDNRLNTVFEELNEIVPFTIAISDKNYKVFYLQGDDSFPIDSTVNNYPSIIESSKSMKTTIGHIFEDSKVKVLLSNPYYVGDSFEGTVIASFALEDIVAQHGNIESEDEEFLFIIDKNYDIIVDPVLVGHNLFDETVIGHIGLEENEARHYDHVLGEEKFYTSVYSNNLGERIDTGSPIMINGEIEYFLFIISPTAPMRNLIADMTFVDQAQTTALLVIVGFFVIGFSLKQRKKIKNDKLAIIGKLSSNIAHDIRNPLGTIQNSRIIIEKENDDRNERISRELNRIKTSTKRISHQIEEVLNYVRTTPLHLRQNSLLKTIQDAINSIDIPETIDVKLPQNNVTFVYDQEKILIVFVNVILNAIQAIDGKNGHISISVDEKRSDVIVNVENSGPAISDDVLPKLFEPLFTTRLKGTGLGLSSCKNIIEQHDGSMSINQMPVKFSIKISKNLK